MYSADGIGRTGHRLLAITLLAIGFMGMALLFTQTGVPSAGYLLYGSLAVATALVAQAAALWVVHRPPSLATTKPTAAKVPTPPLDASKPSDTLFEYGDDEMDDTPLPAADFEGTVPRATVVDERPPPPPIPDVVQTRHDFTAKYTQGTPQVREILTHAGSGRPQRVQARLADPGSHPSSLPPATMRGKCSGCESLVLAPTHRPIELECPACNRVTLLE